MNNRDPICAQANLHFVPSVGKKVDQPVFFALQLSCRVKHARILILMKPRLPEHHLVIK